MVQDSLAQQFQAFAGAPDPGTRITIAIIVTIVVAITILLMYGKMKEADKKTERML